MHGDCLTVELDLGEDDLAHDRGVGTRLSFKVLFCNSIFLTKIFKKCSSYPYQGKKKKKEER